MKNTLRLSEVYVSVQGEGPRTGTKTQFVRFAGCNMKCPGWPCDTQHAIDPAIYMKEGGSEKLVPDELASYITRYAQDMGASNICLTGGEPLLQEEYLLHATYTAVRVAAISLELPTFTWEVFTNGSRHIPTWMLNNFHIMMDWKLTGSGEALTKAEERLHNAKRLGYDQGIKFVCKDIQDLEEAAELMIMLRQVEDVTATFWVGTAWATLTEAEIVEYILEHNLPAKLNVQLHKYVWPADARCV